jgi:ribose 1,5-bisphosphokinase
MSGGRNVAGTGGPGVFIAVVGPSGAGKDTLIARAREALRGHNVHFVRRVVTRPADAKAEDHDCLDEAAFRAAEAGGAFALSWRAHGLSYGLPACVDETIATGGVAVANVSRAAVPMLKDRYARVIVVHVTASQEERARRLAARGRETVQSISARLARTAAGIPAISGAVEIDNSGAVEDAASRLIAVIEAALSRTGSQAAPAAG